MSNIPVNRDTMINIMDTMERTLAYFDSEEFKNVGDNILLRQFRESLRGSIKRASDEIDLNFVHRADTDIIKIDFGAVKITFLNSSGKQARYGDTIRTHQFMVEGPGINPNQVKSIELPKFSYEDGDLAVLKIELYAGDLSSSSSAPSVMSFSGNTHAKLAPVGSISYQYTGQKFWYRAPDGKIDERISTVDSYREVFNTDNPVDVALQVYETFKDDDNFKFYPRIDVQLRDLNISPDACKHIEEITSVKNQT